MCVNDPRIMPASGIILVLSSAVSVYPYNLKFRPVGVRFGPNACTWHALHGMPVWRAKLGSAWLSVLDSIITTATRTKAEEIMLLGSIIFRTSAPGRMGKIEENYSKGV